MCRLGESLGSSSSAARADLILSTNGAGSEYLIAVNVDKGRSTARFDFGAAESGRITEVRLLFEAGRRVAVNASVFEDGFDEMGVHVYELCPCKSSIPYV